MPLSSAPSAYLPSAYLLVSHGSRDPRPEIAINHLVALLSQQLQTIEHPAPVFSTPQRSTPVPYPVGSAPLIGTAVLELAPLPLHQQIQQFAHRAQTYGYTHIQIVPLFLLPGVHVMEDIPTEVELARSGLPGATTLEICPYVGQHPRLKHLFLTSIESNPAAAPPGKILVSHGSRRAEGNRPVETIAAELGAIPAYWSVAPDLETQVSKLIQQGCQQIVILPYFLFEGGISDAIAATVERLATQFPYVQLQLFRPIGATPQLADLVMDLVHTAA